MSTTRTIPAPNPLWRETVHHPECEQRGHPPVTHNPRLGLWWCACGHTIRTVLTVVDGRDHWTCCPQFSTPTPLF